MAKDNQPKKQNWMQRALLSATATTALFAPGCGRDAAYVSGAAGHRVRIELATREEAHAHLLRQIDDIVSQARSFDEQSGDYEVSFPRPPAKHFGRDMSGEDFFVRMEKARLAIEKGEYVSAQAHLAAAKGLLPDREGERGVLKERLGRLEDGVDILANHEKEGTLFDGSKERAEQINRLEKQKKGILEKLTSAHESAVDLVSQVPALRDFENDIDQARRFLANDTFIIGMSMPESVREKLENGLSGLEHWLANPTPPSAYEQASQLHLPLRIIVSDLRDLDRSDRALREMSDPNESGKAR